MKCTSDPAFCRFRLRRVPHLFQVLLPAERCGIKQTSKAQAEQIRAVSIDRIGTVLGRLPPDLIERLDQAIRLHLSL